MICGATGDVVHTLRLFAALICTVIFCLPGIDGAFRYGASLPQLKTRRNAAGSNLKLPNCVRTLLPYHPTTLLSLACLKSIGETEEAIWNWTSKKEDTLEGKVGFPRNVFLFTPWPELLPTLYFLASGEIESTDDDYGGQQVEEERVVVFLVVTTIGAAWTGGCLISL